MIEGREKSAGKVRIRYDEDAVRFHQEGGGGLFWAMEPVTKILRPSVPVTRALARKGVARGTGPW
ncbi:hypothetical protein GCM10010320_45780 [Streptomyces caelestis]|nr:hypothetical protein GCM10010320_45780 [Streptomyces caelestis]